MFYALLLAALSFVIICFGWRFCSRYFELPCPTWLSWLLELDNPFTAIHSAKTIMKNSEIAEGMTVLDVGCGPGRVAIPMAQKVGPNGSVSAMDIQAGMIERAKEKAQKANLHNISFLHAGIGEGKLDAQHFDRALLVTVLGEIPNRERALKEIYASLKPGGILSVTEIIFDPHFLRQGTVISLAVSAGFQEKNIFGNSFAFTATFVKPV